MDSSGYSFNADNSIYDSDRYGVWDNEPSSLGFEQPSSLEEMENLELNANLDEELGARNSNLAKGPSENLQTQQKSSSAKRTFPGLAQASSTSGSSSHSSSPDSILRDQQMGSSQSPPTSSFPFSGDGSTAFEHSSGLTETGLMTDPTSFIDSERMVDTSMDNLSLGPMSSTSRGQDSLYSPVNDPGNFSASYLQTSEIYPGSTSVLPFQPDSNVNATQTVHPSSTFLLNSSPTTPNESSSINSKNHSSNSDAFNDVGMHSPSLIDLKNVDHADDLNLVGGLQNQAVAPRSVPFSDANSPSVIGQPQRSSKWPCNLTVGATPEKSRVETQIPINLTLFGCPNGINKLHLPSHSISKPKFQQKPPYEKSEDTLELSTLLVCASAFQKEGMREKLFERAESDEVPIRNEESPGKVQDENDPKKPLNGAPVTICNGCITRERKRAARKKTKKVEEEEEWLKDEEKRVIVFNCPEVRDWTVPNTKETPVKDSDMMTDSVALSVPMRIACYCRHQGEKVGFIVIFTIKTHSGQILAQAASRSIMITDDHKQPVPNSQTYNFPQTSGPSFFDGVNPFPMYGGLQTGMPFRPSLSTPNLSALSHQVAFNHQAMDMGLYNDSNQSTASATPRNLSRPPSPTQPGGQPGSKKRRSGGISHNKVPSMLTMTKLDRSPHNRGGSSAGPTSAGLSSSGFSFMSPASATYSSAFSQSTQSMQAQNRNRNLHSGPTTPLGFPNGYGSPGITDNDPSKFYSAPTSQKHSRAPSPSSALRKTQNPVNQDNVPVPDQLAALSNIGTGFNLKQPPTIAHLIPQSGPMNRDVPVTVLGSGFYRGLNVMFGDTTVGTHVWSGDTMICQAPRSSTPGPVPVLFPYQHPNAPAPLRNVQALAPTRNTFYTYEDADPLTSNFSSDSNSTQLLPQNTNLRAYGRPTFKQEDGLMDFFQEDEDA